MFLSYKEVLYSGRHLACSCQGLHFNPFPAGLCIHWYLTLIAFAGEPRAGRSVDSGTAHLAERIPRDLHSHRRIPVVWDHCSDYGGAARYGVSSWVVWALLGASADSLLFPSLFVFDGWIRDVWILWNYIACSLGCTGSFLLILLVWLGELFSLLPKFIGLGGRRYSQSTKVCEPLWIFVNCVWSYWWNTGRFSDQLM